MEHKKHYSGLSQSEVAQSRLQHGENILTPPAKESVWILLLEKFTDPIIIILLVALLSSIGVACYQFFSGLEGTHVFLEPVGIFIAVLLATVVGFYFELSANKKFEILNKVNDDTPVKVIRDSQISEVLKREIVVGDIILLESGEEIPADCELLEAISMRVNESTLTGEPITRKTTDPKEFSKDATYPSNHVMRGTSVVEGHGVARVVVVGDNTEYGKVYTGSQIDNGVETPLEIQLNGLANIITKASYAIAALITVGRLLSYFHGLDGAFEWLDFGSYILNTIMIAVTVIVVAVPEGLPMSVTLSLALSMNRMLSTNNLVRKMHACETMGATTVICTDKTGTLTQNQMRVYQSNFYSLKRQTIDDDQMSGVIKESIALNSTAHLDSSDHTKSRVLGNPTEGALLLWLKDSGVNYLELRERISTLEQVPFSTERKYMATIIRSEALGKDVIYVKGAPEIVLALSQSVLVDNELIPTAEFSEQITTQLTQYQNQAMRTLGFAYQIIEPNEIYIENGELTKNNLIYLGITAISDPIRSDVPEAINECRAAGVEVKIVTGDTPNTAKEIGRQIGLWSKEESDSHHITGPEFAALSNEELLERVESIKIVSRARPMDKQRLVQMLQQRDQVVAVTGDGTNDAPALKAAQVGLSMGDGTSVAKEASDITILDNSFSSISRAVMWGRSLYQNIQRFILFQMTINVVACLIVLGGAFLGTESPLTVTQMLWVNLIMDTFAALALASLPPNKSVMNNPPRRSGDHILSKRMIQSILGVGILFVVLLFGLLQYFKHVDITSLSDFSVIEYIRNYFNFEAIPDGLSPYELSLFFTIFVMLQFWNLFNAKAFMSGGSAFTHLKGCSGFILTSLVILVGQVGIVSLGGDMFNVVPLDLGDWIIIIVSTSLVLITGEIVRIWLSFSR